MYSPDYIWFPWQDHDHPEGSLMYSPDYIWFPWQDHDHPEGMRIYFDWGVSGGLGR